MNIEEFREYCLSKKYVVESFPFDESTLVFKVVDKIFAITNLNKENFSVNLKCNPEYAIELREEYEEVIPGFHMNKKHWNTIYFEGVLSNEFLIELIDHSYESVIKSFSNKKQKELGLYSCFYKRI